MTLQRSLLPDRLPDVPGVELAARFRAGSAEADVGGDWYDVFGLPDGRLVLVVGDVMGKGVRAAAGMGRLRSALRALAHANPLPEAVLSGLDKVFSATEDADQIATLVYLLVNPVARRAAVGGAGHLPLVLRAGRPGPASWSTRAPGPPRSAGRSRGPSAPWSSARATCCSGSPTGWWSGGAATWTPAWPCCSRRWDRATRPLDTLVERVDQTLLPDTPGRDDATVLAVRFAT